MADVEVLAIIVAILILVIVSAIMVSSLRIINPWEQGLEMRLGSYIGKLDPGMRFVAPLVSTVIRVDLRTQEQEVPMQQVVMKNRVVARVNGYIYFKVVDSVKSSFQINNYKVATVAVAQTTIRSLFAEVSAVEVAKDRDAINARLRNALDETISVWGVRVEGFELRRFETTDGTDLWKELAVPAPLAQLKLHSVTPLEEAATLQVMAARALLEKLRLDNRDVEAFREPMENAEKALASGDHAGAFRLALQVSESGLGNL